MSEYEEMFETMADVARDLVQGAVFTERHDASKLPSTKKPRLPAKERFVTSPRIFIPREIREELIVHGYPFTAISVLKSQRVYDNKHISVWEVTIDLDTLPFHAKNMLLDCPGRHYVGILTFAMGNAKRDGMIGGYMSSNLPCGDFVLFRAQGSELIEVRKVKKMSLAHKKVRQYENITQTDRENRGR